MINKEKHITFKDSMKRYIFPIILNHAGDDEVYPKRVEDCQKKHIATCRNLLIKVCDERREYD